MASDLNYSQPNAHLQKDITTQGTLKTGYDILANVMGFGNTELKYVLHLGGASMSDAIAAEVMAKVYNPPNVPTPTGKRDSYNPANVVDKDGKDKLDISQINTSEFEDVRHASMFDDITKSYNALELIAYQILVNQHAYQSIQAQNNSIAYFAANKEYSVSASEGYIGNGVGYITLAIARQNEELQRYTIMLKYHDERNRKVAQDERLAKDIDELLVKVSEKGNLDDNDVLELIQKLLKDRINSEENLAVTELQFKQIESTIKKRLSLESHDKLSSMILMLEIEKSVKFKQLVLRKEPKKEDQAVDIEVPKKEIPYSYVPSYLGNIAEYLKNLEKKRRDFTHLAPFKTVHKFPANGMGSVLGFTYLGENFMGIRDDLYGPELHEVELHEAIHTPDEYETRVITKWMLDGETKYH